MRLTDALGSLLRFVRRPHFANVGIYMGFAMLTSVIGFATVMITTRLVPPAEYGLIGVFFSVLFFVAPVVSVSADGLVAVKKAGLTAAGYLDFQRTYVALAYTAFALVQLLFLGAWLAGLYNTVLLAGAPLFGLVRFLAGMAATEYVVEQRSVAFGVMTAATSLFALLLTVILIKTLGPWGGYRVIAMFSADLLMLSIRYWGRLGLLLRPCWSQPLAKQIVAFGAPSVISVAGGWALNESDKLVVAHEAGMHEAGVYAAAAALATIMMTFNQSLTNALYPELFRRLARDPQVVPTIVMRYAATFVSVAGGFCAVVLGTYFLVADLVLPHRYLGGSAIFVALVLSSISVSLYRPFGLVAEYLQWNRMRAVAIVAGGLVTIGIAVLGVRHGSLLWAPAGIAAGYVCATLVLAAGLRLHRQTA